MKRHDTRDRVGQQRMAAALRDTSSNSRHGEPSARPGALQERIDQSPRMLAQRRAIDAASASAAPVQRVKTILRNGDKVTVDEDYSLSSGERLPFDPRKRERIDRTLREARAGVQAPRVGISNRPGLGFDASVFNYQDERAKHDRVVPTSLPPGFQPLPYVAKEHPDYPASLLRAEQEKVRVQGARDPSAVKRHLDDVSGLFIPGGQDRDPDLSAEKTTRHGYESALCKEARNRGLPTLAVCGGSRAFASAFGGRERELSKPHAKTHDKTTGSQAHGLTFPDPHTLIGGATPTVGTLDSINSTHKKVVDTDVQGGLAGVPDLPGTGRTIKRPQSEGGDVVVPKESELVVSALDSAHGTPEGFETRYGAPLMGITSHPEAIYRGGSDRDKATTHAKSWSDSLFKGFDQSMRAYSGKQEVNEDIRARQARRDNPRAYEKWRGKRNWQKLLQLGMITQEEAQGIRAEVAAHRQRKADYYRRGRPGHEWPDPNG
jgi:gamma-glutamyl-gamma-aminobutyrate hydrolase PuuD